MTPWCGFLNRTNNIIDTFFMIKACSPPTALHTFSDVCVVEGLVLEGLLPDLAEADRRVEAVEDGQRHRHVRDDRPHPLAAVEFHLKHLHLVIFSKG